MKNIMNTMKEAIQPRNLIQAAKEVKVDLIAYSIVITTGILIISACNVTLDKIEKGE